MNHLKTTVFALFSCPVSTLITLVTQTTANVIFGKFKMMEEEYTVQLKLPTFWASQPQVGFTQAKAQFNFQKIATDETRYY